MRTVCSVSAALSLLLCLCCVARRYTRTRVPASTVADTRRWLCYPWATACVTACAPLPHSEDDQLRLLAVFWLATSRFEPRAAHKRKGKIESFVQSKLGEEAYVRNAAQPYDAQPRAEAHVLAVLVRLYSGICSSSRPCRSTWSGSVQRSACMV